MLAGVWKHPVIQNIVQYIWWMPGKLKYKVYGEQDNGVKNRPKWPALANYFMLGRVYCMVSIGTHEVYRATKMCE